MREFTVEEKSCCDEEGRQHTFRYSIVVDEVLAGNFTCEDFGVKVEETGGECSIIRGITPSQTRIKGLIALLTEHLVTPVNLPDVIQDWL